MAERQSRRRKKRDDGQSDKPTDEETAVGKYLRFNLATKSSNFMGHKVEYFTGSKAVDLLLDSKWASGKKDTEILFTDRSSVVQYLERLLQKGMFHRALKVVKKNKKDEKKEIERKKEDKAEKEVKKGETKAKKEKGDKKESKEKSEKEVKKGETEKEEETSKAKKSKEGKRKIKLEPTEDQVFKDGNDAYVWIYDPVKPMYYVYGLLLVVGAITVCLFPLWPPWMRAGTYYLSLGGAGVVGSIFALAIVRFILFAVMWSGTMGRIHLWIFPNLLADVGILESFQPTYEYIVNKPDTESTKDTTADGDDGDEKARGNKEGAAEKTGQDAEEVKEAGNKNEDEQNEDDDEDDEDETGSGSSSTQENREEFEIIEPEDISVASQEADS